MQKLEPWALAAVPCVLVLGLWFQGPWALLSAAVVIAALAIVLAGWETSTPALRQFLPAVSLAALGAVGRMLFAAVPDVKPLSAIVILTGASLGSRSGFLCGALAALVSNLFFGQGSWTPWQMYAWGLMGYMAGVWVKRGWLRTRNQAALFGFVAALGFGLIMNGYTLVGFIRPLTWASVVITCSASLVFDLVHGAATAAFLWLLWDSWGHVLKRFKQRYGLLE